jgi:hypothetical protein
MEDFDNGLQTGGRGHADGDIEFIGAIISG